MADDVVVAISSINNMAAGISGAINDLQRLQSQVQQMSGSSSPMQSGLSSLSQGFRTVLNSVGSLASGFMNAMNPLELFHSSAMRLLEVMAVWRVFEYGTQKIQEFLGSIWQIPIAMEKAQTSWAYMFNTEPTAGQNLNDWLTTGQGNAAQIMNWTKKFSIDIPYTRQDLIQAITTLSASNLSVKGVQQYLPILADIAAVRSPGTPLAYIAQAVQEGEFGLTRMLRTQLHLMPEQLAPYGYDESNFSTMLPALQQYSMAHGLTKYTASGQDQGAAYLMAHKTFWGELSSFWDRIQNSEWATGEAGPFQTLKNGLEWLNNFMDNNSPKINGWATLFGVTLSDAMQTAGKAFLGFAQGLQDSGLGHTLDSVFTSLDKWFKDPNTQKGFQVFFSGLGTLGGNIVQQYGKGAAGVAQGAGTFWSDLGPGGQQRLLGLLGLPATFYGSAGMVGGGWLSLLGSGYQAGGSLIGGHPGDAFQQFMTGIMQWGTGWGGAGDNLLNWAGINDHGAGANFFRTMQQRLPLMRAILSPYWHGFLGALTIGGTDLGNFFGTGVPNAWNQGTGAIGGFFGGLWNNLFNGPGPTPPPLLSNSLRGAMPGFDQLGKSIQSGLSTAWTGAVNAVTQQFPSFVTTWVSNLETSVTTGLANLTHTFYQAGQNFFKQLLQGLTDALPQLAGFFGKLEQKIASEFGQILRTPGGWRVPGIPGV